MSRLTPTIVGLFAVLLVACSEGPQSLPTTPRSDLTGQPTCQKTDAQYLAGQINNLFASSIRNTAKKLEAQVESLCPSTTPTLDYITQILTWRSQGLVTGSNTDVWTYFTRLLFFDGFTLNNTAAALGSQGFAGVCGPSGCKLVAVDAATGDSTSGILIPAGALTTRYLVSGAPASCSTIAGQTNLQVWGQCVRISVDPRPLPTFSFQPNTQATVEVCLAEGTPSFLFFDPVTNTGKGKLSELSETSTRVKVTPPAGRFFTPDCDPAIIAQAWPEGGSLVRRGEAVLARSMNAVFHALEPRPAYAVHSGLGGTSGSTGGLSLFGPVDPFLFNDTFSNDAIGSVPATDDRGRGTWTTVTLNPGDISVQASLGDINSNLVVLNQAGGAATQKTGIQLIGHPFTASGQPSFANAGVYQLRWRAEVASPRVFDAPFIIRDSNGAILAQFHFLNGQNAQSGPITYNGQTVGTWTQFVSQFFQITIDLDNHVTSFGIVDPRTGLVTTLVSNSPFTAVNLAQFGWELTGIDAQIIGSDDYELLRLPDAP